jgi:hypothetical protein
MQNRARLISGVYAGLVLLLGCALTLIGLMLSSAVHIGSEPAPIFAGFLGPGIAFLISGVFIWLRRTWALSAAWLIALLYWFLIWSQERSYLLLIVIPIVFALLDLYTRRLGGVITEAGEDAPPPAGI